MLSRLKKAIAGFLTAILKPNFTVLCIEGKAVAEKNHTFRHLWLISNNVWTDLTFISLFLPFLNRCDWFVWLDYVIGLFDWFMWLVRPVEARGFCHFVDRLIAISKAHLSLKCKSSQDLDVLVADLHSHVNWSVGAKLVKHERYSFH